MAGWGGGILFPRLVWHLIASEKITFLPRQKNNNNMNIVNKAGSVCLCVTEEQYFADLLHSSFKSGIGTYYRQCTQAVDFKAA